MPTDNANINPYQSPAEPAGQEPTPPGQAAAGTRGFRWRMIPVTLLYIFSGVIMMATLVPVLSFAELLQSGIAYLPTGESIFWLLPLAGCAGMVAFMWFFAARSLWHGRWRRGMVAFVLGLAAYLGTSVLSNWLGL